MKKFLVLLGILAITSAVFAQDIEGELAYGDTVTGEVGGDVDEQFWTFDGAAGDIVSIAMTADPASDLDTYLWLYDEDEVPLTQVDDIAGSLNSAIEDFELPATGTYIIGARALSGEGEYTLSLSAEGGAAGAEIRQWASDATATSSYGTDSWSPAQATGEPNTEECGDRSTAWASASSQGEDSLTVTFDTPVYPTQINIYQTYTPGSIISVDVTAVDGEVYEIEDSADPVGNTECPGVFTLDIEGGDILVDSVTINFDQTIGGSWNEIDAVELVGTTESGLRQWASSAEASSEYGSSSWTAAQATGEPDTEACGDYGTAWASATRTGEDFLILGFDVPVIPSQVNIYQTYNPGSIISVELVNEDGDLIELEDSADPLGNTECPGVFSLNIAGVDDVIIGVVINFDQTIGGSWNEIDAVELVGSPVE